MMPTLCENILKLQFSCYGICVVGMFDNNTAIFHFNQLKLTAKLKLNFQTFLKNFSILNFSAKPKTYQRKCACKIVFGSYCNRDAQKLEEKLYFSSLVGCIQLKS